VEPFNGVEKQILGERNGVDGSIEQLRCITDVRFAHLITKEETPKHECMRRHRVSDVG
jgi:hypothetical protein